MTPSSTRPALGNRSFVFQLYAIAGNTLLGLLYGLFAWASFKTWQSTDHAQMLVLAIQELLVVGLVVTRRRSIEESRSVWDWSVALVGTGSPLLQRPAATLPALEPIGLGLQFVGTLLAVTAVLSLGRSFGIVAANRGVRTTGFYRFVRHPLYGSYMVGYLGFLIGNMSFQNIALMVVAFVCQYLRAVAEERILARDPEYRAYMARVRYRFLPYIF